MSVCTCDHAPDDHSSLAGCLASSGESYCTCTAGPVAVTLKAEAIAQEAATAPVHASRAQTLTEGRRRRDEGAQAAGSGLPGHVESEWRRKADTALADLIASGLQFTADDLTEKVGMPPKPNMLGGVFVGARQSGQIKAVGYAQATRAASHARVVRVWVAA